MAGKYTVIERLGRTVDGRIVPYEDVDAAFLAYRPGDEIPSEVARTEGIAVKEVKPPENKMEQPAENKGGFTIDRPVDEPEEEAEKAAEPAGEEPEPDSELVCPECGFKAKARIGLNSHMRHQHGVE